MKFKGEVVHGSGIAGNIYKIPTANLIIEDREGGVFVGEAKYRNETYQSLICIHRNQDNETVLETHFIDQKIELYGEEIEVQVKQKIRDLIPFESHESMYAQMQQDLRFARHFFSTT